MYPNIRHLQHGLLRELPLHVDVPLLDPGRRIMERDCTRAATGVPTGNREAAAWIRRSSKTSGELQIWYGIRVKLDGLIAKKTGGIVG